MSKLKKQRDGSPSAGRAAALTATYAVLTIFALIFLVPFLFALATSFTEPNNIYVTPFQWIPRPVTAANYAELFSRVNILRGFVNTMLYIIPPVFVGVFTSAMAAYSLSRLRFPGKKLIFSLLVGTMVIPAIITMIPAYVMFSTVYRLNGTPWPIILPGMFGSVMTMFFLRQFFMTLPAELEEAALIDGMTRGGIFLRVVLPLSKAAIITQIILSLNGAYNDYLTPLLYVGSSPKLHTLQLMISNLQTKFQQPYTLMMAGAIVALVPTLVMFVFAQRYFVEGIVMSGLKG